MRRSFVEFVALAASLPHLERIVPTYVSAVIAALHSMARLDAAARTKDMDDRKFLIPVAIMPLTELLAERGPAGLVPIIHWMIAGGEEAHYHDFISSVNEDLQAAAQPATSWRLACCGTTSHNFEWSRAGVVHSSKPES